METTTNYGLKKPGADDLYNVEDFNGNADTIDTNMKSISDKANSAASSLSSHTANKSNPHGVTKDQVGLGNVPNVATNSQTPTYSVPSSVAEMSSGETLAVAFGKIAKFIKDGITHFSTLDTNVSNAGKNAGTWIGSQTIASGASHKVISNNAISATSIIDVYYSEGSKETVMNAVPSYSQENGNLTIFFENALESVVVIQNIRVVNV